MSERIFLFFLKNLTNYLGLMFTISAFHKKSPHVISLQQVIYIVLKKELDKAHWMQQRPDFFNKNCMFARKPSR